MAGSDRTSVYCTAYGRDNLRRSMASPFPPPPPGALPAPKRAGFLANRTCARAEDDFIPPPSTNRQCASALRCAFGFTAPDAPARARPQRTACRRGQTSRTVHPRGSRGSLRRLPSTRSRPPSLALLRMRLRRRQPVRTTRRRPRWTTWGLAAFYLPSQRVTSRWTRRTADSASSHPIPQRHGRRPLRGARRPLPTRKVLPTATHSARRILRPHPRATQRRPTRRRRAPA